MSASTITILFLIFAIVSFIIRKDSTGAYRYDCSNRIKCDRGSGRFPDIQRICKQQRDSVRWNVCSRTGTF